MRMLVFWVNFFQIHTLACHDKRQRFGLVLDGKSNIILATGGLRDVNIVGDSNFLSMPEVALIGDGTFGSVYLPDQGVRQSEHLVG